MQQRILCARCRLACERHDRRPVWKPSGSDGGGGGRRRYRTPKAGRAGREERCRGRAYLISRSDLFADCFRSTVYIHNLPRTTPRPSLSRATSHRAPRRKSVATVRGFVDFETLYLTHDPPTPRGLHSI